MSVRPSNVAKSNPIAPSLSYDDLHLVLYLIVRRCTTLRTAKFSFLVGALMMFQLLQLRPIQPQSLVHAARSIAEFSEKFENFRDRAIFSV